MVQVLCGLTVIMLVCGLGNIRLETKGNTTKIILKLVWFPSRQPPRWDLILGWFLEDKTTFKSKREIINKAEKTGMYLTSYCADVI